MPFGEMLFFNECDVLGADPVVLNVLVVVSSNSLIVGTANFFVYVYKIYQFMTIILPLCYIICICRHLFQSLRSKNLGESLEPLIGKRLGLDICINGALSAVDGATGPG